MHLTTSTPHPRAPYRTPDAKLLSSHIAAISSHAIPIMRQFLREFCATRPDSRSAFPLAAKREQYEAAEIFAHVAKHIGEPGSMRGWLTSTGRQLAARGLTRNDCTAAKTVLLAAVRTYSGHTWSNELELAFRNAFEHLFDMMSEGMPEASSPATLRMAA